MFAFVKTGWTKIFEKVKSEMKALAKFNTKICNGTRCK